MAAGSGHAPRRSCKIIDGTTEETLLLHSFFNKEPLDFTLSSRKEISFVISKMEKTNNGTRAFYFWGYKKRSKSSKKEEVHGFYNLTTKKGFISC